MGRILHGEEDRGRNWCAYELMTGWRAIYRNGWGDGGMDGSNLLMKARPLSILNLSRALAGLGLCRGRFH